MKLAEEDDLVLGENPQSKRRKKAERRWCPRGRRVCRLVVCKLTTILFTSTSSLYLSSLCYQWCRLSQPLYSNSSCVTDSSVYAIGSH